MSKLIDLDKISLKKLLEWFIDHAKTHHVTVEIDKNTENGCCYADIDNRIIILNPKSFNKKSLGFAFFHELGHIEVVDRGLYKRMINRHSIQVERWCDTFGEKEANKYFKNANCFKPYHTKRGVKYIAKLKLKNPQFK